MSNVLQRLADYPMVKVPGGEIDLRDDRTTSKWKVDIQPFLLARYPVTKELYFAISQKSFFRGGSWAEEARGCGATCRRRSHPTFAIDDLGFRLARSM